MLKQKGFSLLEQAILFPVGIVIILAAFDLASYQQAKTALNEASKQTLRCLTPADAQCIDSQTAKVEAYYDVYKSSISKAWALDNFDYSGEAAWLGLPNYLYSQPKARVLNQVNYFQRYYPAHQNIEKLNVYANVNYHIEKSLYPRVFTGNSTISTLRSYFRYQNSPNVDYPKQRYSLSHVKGYVARASAIKKIGSISFKTNYYAKLPCFRSKQFNQGISNAKHQANFSRKCQTKRIPITIKITGALPVNNNTKNSQGTVLIHMRGKNFSINGQENGGAKYNLGGRTYSQNDGNVFGNFVPRGAPPNYISSTNGYQEFSKYQNIKVTPGNYYTIDFYLRKNGKGGNRTRWNGGVLSVMPANYTKKTKRVKCEQYTKVGSTYRCDGLKLAGQTVPTEAIASVQVEKEITKKNLGCFQTEKDCAANKCIISLHAPLNSCSQVKAAKINCPFNYGVSANPNTNSYQEAQSICPVRDPHIHPEKPISYSEKDIFNIENLHFQYTRENCSAPLEAPTSLYPKEVAKYKKLTWLKKERLADLPFYTEDFSPSKFREENPEYACSDIKEYKENFAAENESILGIDTSLFNGTYNILDTGCQWEETLKHEAEDLGLASDAYFKAKRKFIGQSYVNTKPSLACYNGTEIPILKQDRELIPGGPYIADKLPQDCEEENSNCQLEFHSYKKIKENLRATDYAAAFLRGFDVIQATYPRAFFDCNSKDINTCFEIKEDEAFATAKLKCTSNKPSCVEFELLHDKTEERFDVNFKMASPTTVLPIHGKRMNLSNAQSGIWEGKYINFAP